MTVAPTNVSFNENTMRVELADGRVVAVPLSAFPRLLRATATEREQVELSRHGLHWDALDEDISIAGLLTTVGADKNALQIDELVLGTTNAPYRRSITANELADALTGGGVSGWLVHVATFFTEIRPELVLAFANVHGISPAELSRAYHASREATGEANPALEKLLEQLAETA